MKFFKSLNTVGLLLVLYASSLSTGRSQGTNYEYDKIQIGDEEVLIVFGNRVIK